MVEVALAIAIVAFAMVAIIGVMPSGMRVQKENREETIINQDGTYWLEAIRGGARGLDELTNYVDLIQHKSQVRSVVRTNAFSYGRGYVSGEDIIGLLSQPKYTLDRRDEWSTNTVEAFVRAISGMAAEKPDGAHTTNTEFAFTYRLRSEIIPFQVAPPSQTNFAGTTGVEFIFRTNLFVRSLQLATNLYELRVILDWPVYQAAGGLRVGNNRKVFRTLAGGALTPTNVTRLRTTLYFLEPSTYTMIR